MSATSFTVVPSDSPLVLQAKKKAKHLQSILRLMLPEIKHTQCLHIISKLERERDWNTYLAKLNKDDAATIVSSGPCEGSTGSHRDKLLRSRFLPIITETAVKYGMGISVQENFSGVGVPSGLGAGADRIEITIEPLGAQGTVSCDGFLEVTDSRVLLFSRDRFYLAVNLLFPKQALPLLTSILSSPKLASEAEPQLTRVESAGVDAFLFTVNTSAISDIANRGFTIENDPGLLPAFQRSLEKFLTSFKKVTRAYLALQGKWGNNRLALDLENALWRLGSDEPPYMATSGVFYVTTIAGLSVSCVLGHSGPYVLAGEGSVEIGVCSIIHLPNGYEGSAPGYYVAKYGDAWQARIHLPGFTEEDIDQLTAEIGIPKGRFAERDTRFLESRAFRALQKWAKDNPKFVKRIAKSGERYLPGWLDALALVKSLRVLIPTQQEFESAVEKVPYLLHHGIRCACHIDWDKTPEENAAAYTSDLKSFLGTGLREFRLCCEWLKGLNKIKTINTWRSSYSLKEYVEEWAMSKGETDSYVSNGAFIAAAVHMGFTWKQGFDSPNVLINFSRKSPALVRLR